ncbi:TPA: ATP-dependent DNA helicase [Candidatus Woesearchaeota archaeon]|nr:ATP-dependent DNA helicase [Candidatus Woesearchaeota archaeon]
MPPETHVLDPPSILFPYDKVRNEQSDMIACVLEAVQERKHTLIHAPTGLGKTAATLAPLLSKILSPDFKDKKLTIFFLTSRHTQHKLALDTLRLIKEKYNISFDVVDLIGKKLMCLQPGANLLQGTEFNEYCKSVREDKSCEFYVNVRESVFKLTPHGHKVVDDLKTILPIHVEVLMEACKEDKVCPYEITAEIAKDARVIIADYYYLFHPSIRERFFSKIGKELEQAIIIVDEGHNLPSRIQKVMTSMLTTNMIKYAIKEAKKYGYTELIEKLQILQTIFLNIAQGLSFEFGGQREKLAKKEQFMQPLAAKLDQEYDAFIDEMEVIADAVRILQKHSFIGGIAQFLKAWKGQDEGFVRIMNLEPSKTGPVLKLSHRCLDPSLVAKGVIEQSYVTIMMSGTMLPTEMYKDLLGFPELAKEYTFDNPFHENNRLAIVIPKTTTKFSMRNDQQFSAIAEICSQVVEAVPGNTAIFFPSYHLRDQVYQHLEPKTKRTCFVETPGMTKQEKTEFIERFKQYKNTGAVLLGAITGSFGEGVDLPGDLLKGVIIVGLPLQTPDLETKQLIAYYQQKFGKGWDYGYILPAFQKTLQGAGRCIRTETDRGVVVFLDERYAWPMYGRCFPEEYQVHVSQYPIEEIEEFFRKF